MPHVLRRLLHPGPPIAAGSVRDHRRALGDATRDLVPIEVALVGGSMADRLGFAFAGGYGAALSAMVPGVPPDAIVALCATEAGGVHPRAIETTLTRAGSGCLELNGKKAFVTLGTDADVLLVVARTGVAAGSGGKEQVRLAVARVASSSPGVTFAPLPETQFAPEIGHASVELDGVAVAEGDVLPGDGYDAYLKPFRTIEDVHVFGAVVGYLIGVAARHGAPAPLRERLLAHAQMLRSIAALPPSAAETHLVLAGAIAATRDLVEACDSVWASAPADERARWERDRPLLRVAEKARALRLEAAWRTVPH